eukprot:CCRYP_010768-RA/>CCRYP_010768-RA protein AED:0.05 eAED:0.05 QI:188/1/1/1/1/1/3/47/597
MPVVDVLSIDGLDCVGNSQPIHESQRSSGDASNTTHSTHDGFTTVVSDNDLLERNPQPPLDITTTNTSPAETRTQKWQRIRRVSLYLLSVTILFSDMNLMAPNLTTIADEFGFDNDERDVKLGGLIALGFFFVGAPVSYIIGWLADSINRTPLFAATVFVGEIGCLMVYFVQTYPQLYACRVLTGISIGGAIPIIYSILGDLYPANQRSIVAAVITTGTGLGMGIGQVIAGLISDWRLPFLIVSIPGILCSFAVLSVKDPPRGAKELAVIESLNRRNSQGVTQESTLSQSDIIPVSVARGDHIQYLENCGMVCEVLNHSVNSECETLKVTNTWNPDTAENNTQNPAVSQVMASHEPLGFFQSKRNCISCTSTIELMKTPSVLLIILQAAPGALPFGFCATFLNDYLQQQRGMTKEAATGVLVTFGAGNAIGVIIGGLLGRSYKKDVRLPPFFMGLSLILGFLPFYFLVNHVDKNANAGVITAITALSGLLVVIPVPLERAILTNVCLPQSRGRANALVSIVDDLGKGLGPALVSLLISTFDRQTAFNISLIGWIVGGIFSLFIMIFVSADEERVQQKLREEMAQNDETNRGEVNYEI